ncbi:hypothetical protein [Haematomicrobium sanguinis]|uniref:hypothetical protein n=1 Tax=Haematomicrobium sanguinis TaxID=479106 RepID=UPI00047C448B|nr:hypothetical protein [Haematomicrobium sanguinis]
MNKLTPDAHEYASEFNFTEDEDAALASVAYAGERRRLEATILHAKTFEAPTGFTFDAMAAAQDPRVFIWEGPQHYISNGEHKTGVHTCWDPDQGVRLLLDHRFQGDFPTVSLIEALELQKQLTAVLEAMKAL